jgi:hypothetical protein
MTTPRRKWTATTRVKRRRKIDAPDRNASREADKASYEAEIAKRLDLTDKLDVLAARIIERLGDENAAGLAREITNQLTRARTRWRARLPTS